MVFRPRGAAVLNFDRGRRRGGQRRPAQPIMPLSLPIRRPVFPAAIVCDSLGLANA